jgi:hypothetical protein
MLRSLPLVAAGSAILALAYGPDPVGPFKPDAWPPTVDRNKLVHYVVTDEGLTPPSPSWQPNLKILTGGDQQTEAAVAGGHKCVQMTGIKFNTADESYPVWANQHTIDILIQFFGDDAILNADGAPRYFNFLTGTLPEPIAVDGGTLPREARNGRWNWALFRISNGLRHMDGGRLVGTIHPKAKSDPAIAGVSRLSGQNGGTIRLDGLHNVKIRVVAFGEKGAFGEPDVINHFHR